MGLSHPPKGLIRGLKYGRRVLPEKWTRPLQWWISDGYIIRCQLSDNSPKALARAPAWVRLFTPNLP
jgi:hypothetical protein